MLSRLNIENIAVIESADIEFGPGLNVLTGETGAGKSIIIDSINLILGERSSRESIRTGAKSANVSALFDNITPIVKSKLQGLGFDADEDDTLLIQREIFADGKNLCRINGRPATVSILKEIGSQLINIHGQHENQTLLSSDRHIEYIDEFGELTGLKESYKEIYNKILKIRSQIKELNMDEAQKARRIDLLQYQINEIEKANLIPGEEEELLSRRSFYINSEKIAQSLQNAYETLNGFEDTRGALELLNAASSSLQTAVRYYPEIETLYAKMEEMHYILSDSISEIRSYLDQLEYDPSELDQIESRLDQIHHLSRKYGNSVEEILVFLDNAKAEFEKIEFSEQQIKELNKELNEAVSLAEELSLNLSLERKKASERFEKSVMGELLFLDMPNVIFSVQQDACELKPNGRDIMEFMISTNVGEPPKPLAKIASGGELSRIMLSIKNVLSNKDSIDTLIFDEIDNGISGKAAQKVGQKLKQVAEGRQVICVTHLAQIAALACDHLLIEKKVDKDRTFTSVRHLNFEGRKYELARIMGGEHITPLILQSAEEMLNNN